MKRELFWLMFLGCLPKAAGYIVLPQVKQVKWESWEWEQEVEEAYPHLTAKNEKDVGDG